MKNVIIALLLLLTSACGTMKYVPEEYEITNDRINDLTVKGDIVIINAQKDSSEKIFFASSMDWVGDYKAVTEHFKSQLEKELSENSDVIFSGGNKTIQVKVTSIRAEQKFFHFMSYMDLEFRLGNGDSGKISVSQGSPGNIWRVLNGTIALGVIDILKQDKVVAYLAM